MISTRDLELSNHNHKNTHLATAKMSKKYSSKLPIHPKRQFDVLPGSCEYGRHQIDLYP